MEKNKKLRQKEKFDAEKVVTKLYSDIKFSDLNILNIEGKIIDDDKLILKNVDLNNFITLIKNFRIRAGAEYDKKRIVNKNTAKIDKNLKWPLPHIKENRIYSSFSEIIWLFMRANPEYLLDFKDNQNTVMHFAWGLKNFINPTNLFLGEEIGIFRMGIAVATTKNFSTESNFFKENFPEFTEEKNYFIFNTGAFLPSASLLKAVMQTYNEDAPPDYFPDLKLEKRKRKSNISKHSVDNVLKSLVAFYCTYYFKCSNKIISILFNEIFYPNDRFIRIKTDQMNHEISQFLFYAHASPFLFFKETYDHQFSISS